MASSRISGPKDFQAQFGVSDETIDRLVIYEEQLRLWQRKINLVAPSTMDDIWHRHFADSAQLFDLAPKSARRWVDLGSGAGFPGLVLAILRAGRGGDGDLEPHVLIESDTRKAAFLGEIARKVSLPVDIAAKRIELSSTQGRYKSVDVVSARALAPLDRLIGLAEPFFGPDTVGLFLKGREVDQEVETAQAKWRFSCSLVDSLTEAQSRIAVVTSPTDLISTPVDP
ncbi:MAG: 16S rRNA (guanine(527)-N(7))-methyltransferase RsmG [Alphaproteobacteria bacterium]|nr:16S rRNA (guanine(527)-N(7))-methyltransferase RsmG [Alphaproteobacteria bacterium]